MNLLPFTNMARVQKDWQDLGATEPYFAVLTEDRFLRENLTEESIEEFYQSGERDVERFLALAAAERGEPVSPRNAIDFGCGVGRLTLPLARRATRVVGVDAASSLLKIAHEAAVGSGLPNVELISDGGLPALDAGTFDFIVSYIVFQHIPVNEGEEYLRKLLRLAAPDATVVLHFALCRRGGALRRLLRRLRGSSRLVHRLVGSLRRERNLPYMQMNEYDRNRLETIFSESGFRTPVITPTDHGGITGGIFVSSRRSVGTDDPIRRST